MALSLDAFRADSIQHGPRCTLAKLLERLEPEERAIVETALADPDVQHQRIADVLTAEGHKMGSHTVSRHRKGRCQC